MVQTDNPLVSFVYEGKNNKAMKIQKKTTLYKMHEKIAEIRYRLILKYLLLLNFQTTYKNNIAQK